MKRFWELDFFRGIAVILMIFFHAVASMNEYGHFFLNLNSPAIFLIGRLIGIMFLTLVGVSLTISYSKNRCFEKYLKRGFGVFSLGMLVTLMSYLYNPNMVIWFGVLHATRNINNTRLLLPKTRQKNMLSFRNHNHSNRAFAD